ncbi:unnamed protein product [Miscanthus lutarioriparius]|uniref:Uncharacterized protein n=1 Tax=Miscanthus lutarioriparius TaxID=422564 RepID=A0A811SFF4_9POAL|nr:unnamed protein product [Miscanthus lutarioriparius]
MVVDAHASGVLGAWPAASSEDIQHVHAEAAARLLAAAVPQVPGIVRVEHRLHGSIAVAALLLAFLEEAWNM